MQDVFSVKQVPQTAKDEVLGSLLSSHPCRPPHSRSGCKAHQFLKHCSIKLYLGQEEKAFQEAFQKTFQETNKGESKA